MQTQSLTVNGQDYPVKFGMGAIRQLGKLWKLASPIDVMQKIGRVFQFKEDSNPTFEQFDTISEVVLSGILNADRSAKVTVDEILDALFADTDKLGMIIELFLEQQPKKVQEEVLKKTRGKK